MGGRKDERGWNIGQRIEEKMDETG